VPSRKLVALGLLVAAACERAESAPVQHDPAAFIVADANGLLRSPAKVFPIFSMLGTMFADEPCWSQLVGKVSAAYQVTVAGAHKNYVIIDGDLRRDDIASCATRLARMGVAFAHDDDDLDRIALRDFTVYAAWRDRLLVVGTKSGVTDALAAHPAAQVKAWHDRIAALPSAPMAAWSNQPLVSLFIGLPTRDFTLGMTTDGVIPAKAFSIRIAARFETAADATEAVRRFKTGTFTPGVDPPPAMVAGLARAKLSTAGDTATLVLDQDTFANLDFATLSTWAMALPARLLAAQAQAH
jgi:hypothetical protein